jgi:hypothetical protein
VSTSVSIWTLVCNAAYDDYKTNDIGNQRKFLLCRRRYPKKWSIRTHIYGQAGLEGKEELVQEQKIIFLPCIIVDFNLSRDENKKLTRKSPVAYK